MRVVALKNHRYDGASYQIGEAYEAQDIYARALILAKVVKPESAPEEPKPKRKYRRRDLNADSEV